MSRFRCVPALLGALLGLAGCDAADDPAIFHGYVEADRSLVGPEDGGRLVGLDVEEGQRVARGAPLFRMDDAVQKARADAAAARLREARAQLEDARAERRRPQEIAILEARRRQAAAALVPAEAERARQEALFARGYASAARRDEARADARTARAALDEAEREIAAARLAARTPQIEAAEAAVAAAEAALAEAEERLARLTVTAPTDALVRQVLFRPGEMVPAGRAVVELLPPERLRLRFFVPEPERAKLHVGDAVTARCDSCPPDLRGRIVFIAPEVEYTPPVIFSIEERAKLVFLVEARPEGAAEGLAPGQPITVRPAPAPAQGP